MDIVYCIDNNFIPQAAALTASICQTAKQSGADQGSGPFVFHILSNGVTKENRQRFISFADSLGAKAFFYDLGDFEGRLRTLLGAKPETGRFVKAALGRIFIPEYLPKEIRKYLYLDADMTVRKDITPLFSLPLDGKVLSAVPEPTIYEDLVVSQREETPDAETTDSLDPATRTARKGVTHRKPLFRLSGEGGQCREPGPGYVEAGRSGLPGRVCPHRKPLFRLSGEGGQCREPGPGYVEAGRSGLPEALPAYFNTGALLVDRDAWEANDTTKKCLHWYAEQNGKFRFADQDILNNVLAGQIKPMPQKWNFQTNYHYQSYDSLVKRAPWFARLQSKEDYEEARKDPAIVHFAGDERPWISGNRNPYRKAYEAALGATPWKDEASVIRGKEAYMQFYHLINVLSGRIPGFRTLVSRIYYLYRKKSG